MKKVQQLERLPIGYPVGKISPRYAGVSDEVLLQKYLEGDGRAFTELYERYKPRVVMGLRKRVECEAIAEEIAQEAFFRVFRYATHFDFSKNFSAWLYVITINLLRNHFRYTRKREGNTIKERARRSSLIPRPETILDPLSQCIEREIEELKLKALGELSFEQACTYLLYENTPMEYEDIAKSTATRLGTVKSRLFRARNGLKRFASSYRD